MSESIKIPDGWNKIELGSIIELLTDYTANGSFESLRDNVRYYNNEEYAVLVRTTDLNKKTFKPERFTDYKGWKYLRKTALYGNEILIANVGSVGNVYKVPFYNQPMTLAPNMYLLKFKDEVSEDYLYYVLTSKEFKINLLKQLGSTTLQSINKDNLRVIEILTPKLKKEQKKISEVLNEVDNAILKTEELFEKNRRLKTALMQDLLSYGIDENEKIRNPQTHKFKPSELSNIPEEWDCMELSKVCEIKDGTHQTPKYVTDGIPFYSVENITNDEFKNVKFISKEEHKELTKNYKIELGDVLMTRIGSIGDCKYINWNVNASFYVSLALLKFYNKEHAKYFVQYSKSEKFKNEIDLHSLPNAIPKKINLGNISNVKILIPKSEVEQEKIAKILSSQDDKIEGIKNKLTKLKSLKASLMQDLLSGKKRVTKLMEENL